MPEEITNPYANQVVQIQIQPVDNGFVMQVANIDGKNKGLRLIAATLDELKKQVVEVSKKLYSGIEIGSSGPETPAGA